VLAGADHPYLCDSCRAAFLRAAGVMPGAEAEHEQLELEERAA
jgi:hypothetical protein